MNASSNSYWYKLREEIVYISFAINRAGFNSVRLNVISYLPESFVRALDANSIRSWAAGQRWSWITDLTTNYAVSPNLYKVTRITYVKPGSN
jgi:hypothetical protein